METGNLRLGMYLRDNGENGIKATVRLDEKPIATLNELLNATEDLQKAKTGLSRLLWLLLTQVALALGLTFRDDRSALLGLLMGSVAVCGLNLMLVMLSRARLCTAMREWKIWCKEMGIDFGPDKKES